MHRCLSIAFFSHAPYRSLRIKWKLPGMPRILSILVPSGSLPPPMNSQLMLAQVEI